MIFGLFIYGSTKYILVMEIKLLFVCDVLIFI
jgi:hypothetical protein